MNADDERSTESDLGTEADGRLKLDAPGELIASLPAMLGFFPTRSVILVLIRRSDGSDGVPAGERMVRSALRFDVDAITDLPSADEMVNRLDVICENEGAVGAMAVIVDDRPRAAETACVAVRLLREMTVGLSNAWFVRAITSGARYHGLLDVHGTGLDAGGTGLVADPRASPIALAQVLDGVQIRSSREEIAALLYPDPVLAAEVQPHLGPAITRYRDSLAAAVVDDQGNTHQRATAKWLLALIADFGDAGCAPADLAAVVAALRDRTIRDVMFGLAATALAPAAQQLWHLIARASTGHDRAEAAVLCGYDAYYRRHGTHAAVCLDAALQAEPSHPMAVLLHVSLTEGLHPDNIRRIAQLGLQVAADLGIDLRPTEDDRIC
ncbi:DUF4192 domain-containing protein [Nocardia sp. MW-W600-9]